MSETTEYRKLILEAVDGAGLDSEQYVKACFDFSHRLRNAQYIQPELLQVTTIVSSEVSELSSEVFLSAFVFNAQGVDEEGESKKQLWCFNLMNQLKYLKRMEDQIATVFGDYQEQSSNLSDKWELVFFKLEKLMFNQAKSEDGETSLFRSNALKVWNAWEVKKEEGEPSLLLTFDVMIAPLKRLIVEELPQGKNNALAIELSKLLEELEKCEAAWSESRKANSEIFETLALKIKEIVGNLKATQGLIVDKTKVIEVA